MENFKQELFAIISEFKEQPSKIDWSIVWNNPELFELALDSLDSLINNFALLEGTDKDRMNLVSKLVKERALLMLYANYEDKEKEFLRSGEALNKLLQEAIQYGDDWFAAAENRFDEYEKTAESMDENDQLPFEKLQFFRPVSIVIAFFILITIDQEEA